jgi:hypothetical protein
MRLAFAVPTVALATVMGLLQSKAHPPDDKGPQWQKVDQLCGDLEFATPKKKTIMVNGKTETDLYANPVKDAEVILYRGTALDKTCCAEATRATRTRSNKFGKFGFSGFQSGWYWLRVNEDNFTATIPLQVTRDFDSKSCGDRSVGRIFTVDAQPPRVEMRIY